VFGYEGGGSCINVRINILETLIGITDLGTLNWMELQLKETRKVMCCK
jgi:hypothetical protein